MDRNWFARIATDGFTVALRKESVDRNVNYTMTTSKITKSLSARRAWIEIITFAFFPPGKLVALRKESVDRNSCVFALPYAIIMSLSARRAWIEMPYGQTLI